MASLRDKTISGVFWSFLQQGGGKAVQFVTTIILARLLTPKDFGLIGMLTIFIAISQTLVQAGFNQALIQKKDTDEEDYSSVFWINLAASIVIYAILFLCAPLIADFYDQPILTGMTRVLSLIFVVNAFSYVQEAKLRKEMKFKTLMVVHIPSTIISGIVAISMALLDFGVWSIVGMQLVMRAAYAVQIWIYAKWKPLRTFNKHKAKKLFSFGGNLMLNGILQTVFQNIYQVIIGKFFSVTQLGYYQNANSLTRSPVSTFQRVISSVSFPAFSSIQDDNKRLKKGLKMATQQILFWICPMMVFGAVLAEPLFRFVLGEKWLPAVPFFQLLCVVGIFRPLNSYNLDMVNVKGRSDVYLKLNIVKKILEGVGIVVAIPFGIMALVGFQAGLAIIKYLLNAFYAGRFIDYPLKEQLKDIWLIFVLTITSGGIIVVILHNISHWSDWLKIIVALLIGIAFYWFIAYVTKFSPYQDFMNIIGDKKKQLFKKRTNG